MIPVKIKGHPYIITIDEAGAAGASDGWAGACTRGFPAFGYPQIIDVADETNPKIIAKLRLQVDDPANCEALRLETPPDVPGTAPGTNLPAISGTTNYSIESCVADNPDDTKMLACGFQNAGLRVFDVSDPTRPTEIAYWKPGAVRTRVLPASGSWATDVDRTVDKIAHWVRWVVVSQGNGNGNSTELQLWTVSDGHGFQVLRFSPVSSLSPDLNQHGLTGSWYKPATSGQGVEIEVYPNSMSGTTGLAFVSWFTYDTVAGGENHQRWYTALGSVVTHQPNATLTIYQNTGGNFNALPTTAAQPVGTATLNFASCTSGQFSYNFTDGSGRTGSIPLTRLTQNVTCATTAPPFSSNTDFALSGNWYDATTAGQGFTIEVNPTSGALFAAWYTYAPMGGSAGAAGQRWYTAQASFTAGMRSIPVTIYETTGGVFNTPMPAPQTAAVGTGTLAFQSCTVATFNYNFTGGSSSGLSGTIPLGRVGPVPPGCTS
jgi:hypothetical protein